MRYLKTLMLLMLVLFSTSFLFACVGNSPSRLNEQTRRVTDTVLVDTPASDNIESQPTITTPQATQRGVAVTPTTSSESQPVLPTATRANNALTISAITDNRSNYPGERIPSYEKFEITFVVENSVAKNYQLPFPADPPNGIDLDYPAHQGISVDAHFTPDNWTTVYQQPAFYYQYFDDQVKESWDGLSHEWFYPLDKFAWKVRFSPNTTGTWQYKLVAEDAGGYTETAPKTFEVTDSENRGFIAVSKTDSRYFEYDDGKLYTPLGFNRGANFDDPVRANEDAYQTYAENGINLLRTWISAMYGAAWLEWIGGRNIYDGYLPRPGILPFYNPVDDQFTMTQFINYEPEGDTSWFDACRYQFWNDPEAVKKNTDYRLRIKYWGEGITGPRNQTQTQYGLVGKISLSRNGDCHEPGTGTVITNYGQNSDDWAYLEGTWNSGDNNFLPRVHIGLENVIQGGAYIQSISLREDFGNGKYGPEIIREPSLEYELYFPEQMVYALDKIITLAEDNEIYLKLVIHDKDDKIFYKMNDDGTFVHGGQKDNQDGFYGVGREVNKTRWLQQAWWRYLQARWGYSTAIHSWELTNEGNPSNADHWALADELGKYMHCSVFGVEVTPDNGTFCDFDHPNAHLVTTSFWNSFPGEPFWANSDYPNVDYADLHAYVSTGWLKDPQYEVDAALFHLDYSAEVRKNLDYYSELNDISTKPIMRGETGLDFLDLQNENPDLAGDTNGVWLHNLIWASLDAGAMSELYWWRDNLTEQPGPDGEPGLYEVYGYFRDFIQDIPLNNGNYQALEVELSDPFLRATGQMDVSNNRAHLWVQNKNHTWRNVVDEVDQISGLTGTVRIDGFVPDTRLTVEWHVFTTAGIATIRIEQVQTGVDGELILNLPIEPEITDVGIKIGDY